MKLLADMPQPPGFAQVRDAFATALELPRWRDAPVRVGLCGDDGQLLAAGVLQDHRQARLLCIQLEAMDWREMDGEPAHARGCDRVFVTRRWHERHLEQESLAELA